MVAEFAGETNAQSQYDVPVLIDFSSRSRQLLVVFAGKWTADGLPRFTMTRAFRALNVKRMFIRDVTNSWYLSDIPGVDRGLFSLAEIIERERRRRKIRRTVCVGCSMGGFGALLFGQLIGADQVLAFSPQSFIDRRNRLLHMDRRSWDLKERLHRSRDAGFRRRFFDLKPMMEAAAAESRHMPEVDLHIAAGHRLDRIHAERLQSLPNVRIHEHPSGDHAFIRQLHASGELVQIVRAAFESEHLEAPDRTPRVSAQEWMSRQFAAMPRLPAEPSLVDRTLPPPGAPKPPRA